MRKATEKIMKKDIMLKTKSLRIAAIKVILSIILFSWTQFASSQENNSERIREIAERFLITHSSEKKSTPETISLQEVYQSPDTVINKIFCFSNTGGGFVLIAENHGDYVITGYSLTGSFAPGTIPEALIALINSYESAGYIPPTDMDELIKATVIVEPLLDKAGVNLNQYYHESLGNCPSGCAATAMAQIMCYYKYPETGTGSVSYVHPTYGEQSVDFENTTYKWTDMTDADYELLSYHVGVAMKMNYCGYQSTGSIPSDPYYQDVLQKHFRYHVHLGSKESYYLYNELDNERPVYCEIPGDPPHAVVLDGYDSEGYFHIHFGWGGSYNGYFLLNSNSTFNVGYTFGTNISSVRCISPVPFITNQQDSLVLASFHYSTGEKTGWDLTKPVVNWRGVLVMNERVIELVNESVYLSGVIPDEIENLATLRKLRIRGGFTSPFPSSITNLTNLKELVIRGSEGSAKRILPDSIDNLNQLETLHLPYLLTGSIPASIGNLTQLKSLDLSSGSLSGEIPEEICNLTELETLNLGGNNLSGSLPSQIGSLTKLKYFFVWNNQLSGALPEGIGNFSDIREFSVSENQFTGTIPESVINWTNINQFSISDNLFEGPLPEAIGTFTMLTGLKVSNNKLTALPENIGNLTNLQTIEADNNLFETVPASISQLFSLYRLYLMKNKIKALPDMGAMPALWDLNLSYNELEILPESFGNFTKLKDLYMGNNKISELPASFERLTTVRMLALNDNKLKAIPSSFCFLGGLRELYIINNEISQPLPPLNHLGLTFIDIRNNKLVFSDLITSRLPDDTIYTDNYAFNYYDQGKVEIKDSLVVVTEGDSVGIDIRNISRLSHPRNEYEWYANDQLVMTGPVLSFSDFRKENEGSFICRVRNLLYQKLLVLETEPLMLKVRNDDLMADAFQVSSRDGKTEFSDNLVLLTPPSVTRGEIVWQASFDSVNWYDVSQEMSNEEIKDNILSVTDNKILTEPKSTLLFRYLLNEGTCDPVISDTIRLVSYGSLLLDTILNVAINPVTVKADSIEIIIPEGFTDEDFRLTVQKLNLPPESPDTVVLGTVYDVKVSCGSIFELPLLIKLKNINKSTFSAENIDKYKAVYYDDKTHEWNRYEDARFSLKDSSLIFETRHLTKLSWWWDEEAVWGYTDVFTRNNIRVFYKESDNDRFSFIYGENQTSQPWHVSSSDPEYGTPLMIQDIAYFLAEVMDKFMTIGLPVPDHNFSVFVKEMDDYGSVGVMGMLNHYLNINRDIEDPEQLRSLLAHEFMHYTQDNYISANAGNIFWMEAHAHLSDRIVWDESVIPVSESEGYLLNGRTGKNTIFEFLSNSWDYWDKTILTQNLRGNVYYCYLAGTFLHYMRSYREGEKLKPDILLKETPSLQGWLDYLDSYIQQYLSSNIGDQYEAFIKYIIKGSNPNFSVLNKTEGEDPLKYLKTASNDFMSNLYFKFNDEDIKKPIVDSVKVDLPYLSSRMVQMYNLNTNHQKVLVKYKRKNQAQENIKAYLIRYDADSTLMTFEDISETDSALFVIDSPTGTNLTGKKYIAYILFINKDKSGSFTVDYEFEITSIPEFLFINAVGFLIPPATSQAIIHVFTDGVNETMDQFHVMPGVFHHFWEDYYSPVTYNSEMTDETINIHSISEHMEQIINYNFLTGDMYIYDKEIWGMGTGPGSNIDVREIILHLKNVWFKPSPGEQQKFFFTTSNTAQTQEVVESISYYRDLATWNYELEQYNPVVRTTYLRTNYEVDNICFYLSVY